MEPPGALVTSVKEPAAAEVFKVENVMMAERESPG
jgi:hypothetical protein